jgi:hypothetical protein
MISVWNMKSTQLRMLFRIFKYGLIQDLRIFGSIEGIYFEFACLSWFLILGKSKSFKQGGACLSVPFRPRQAAVQTTAATAVCHHRFATTPRAMVGLIHCAGAGRDLLSHFTSPTTCPSAPALLCSSSTAALIANERHHHDLPIAIQARNSVHSRLLSA